MPLKHLPTWIALACAAPAFAQYLQQGGKLVPAGIIGSAAAGASVAISADGSTAIVGAPDDNSGVGAAWIYTRIPSSSGLPWAQQGPKLVGSGAIGVAGQGAAVALSADGNTAIVGGPNDNTGTGAIWVFVRSNGVWAQQGPKLWGTVLVGISHQGISVSLSADGNTALSGGDLDSSDIGAAWVFRRSNGVWSIQPDKLVGAGAIGTAHQGAAVALSADGNTAILGGPADNNGLGAAWIFARNTAGPGLSWIQQGAKLAGAGTTANAAFGASVALSADGNTAAIGGSGDSNNAGAVWAFTRSNGQWLQQGAKLQGANPAALRLLGASIALTGDGNTILAGGPGGSDSMFGRSPSVGATWVFGRFNGIWTQQGPELAGSGVATNDALQGTSVSVSADGTAALVGGPTDNNRTGAVWTFTRPPAPSPPVVSTQPASQTISPGQSVTLAVAATGQTPLFFQWYQGARGDTSTPVGTNSSVFTTPPLNVTTSYWVRVTNAFGAADSNTAILTIPPNSPVITTVANAASHFSAIAPNTWVEIKGVNLAPTGDTRIWQSADLVGGRLPVQMDGVIATVNGRPAYIYYISPTQVNILTPPDAMQGPVQVQLTNAGLPSAPFIVQAQPLSPAFFVIGAGPYVAAEHANGTYLGPTTLYPGVTTPAQPSETVVLFGNGFGNTSVPVIGGSVLQSGTLATLPDIRIGGIPATVTFAGLVAPGEFQFNVVVPPNVPAGDNTITAAYNGLTTQGGVLLTVGK